MTKLTFLTVMPSPYQRQLFKQIDQSGLVDLKVVYYTFGANDRDWEKPTLEPFELVLPGSTLTSIGNSAHLNLSVRHWLKERQSDLTIISDYSAPTAQLAMRALAKRKQPFVFWGEAPGFQSRGSVGMWIRKQLQSPLKNATAIAAIGSRASGLYRDLFPDKTVFNIPYFCDLEPYTQAANAKETTASKDIKILFSGQLIERKGIDVLLAAFMAASSTCPTLSIRILGGGPMRDQLEAEVPEDLKNRIEFLGHVEPQHIPPIFAECDAFCLPSRYDGWGVVVNEAIGAGMPVIVSDAVGAGHDLVKHGENGYVVKAGDVASLTEALIQVADNHRRGKMAEAAIATREDWTLERGAQLWLDAVESILGRELVH